MSYALTPAARFHEFRERSGLTPDEAAWRMGISKANVWDLETYHDELLSCYSPSEAARFAKVLGVRTVQFFGSDPEGAPISLGELHSLIHDQCHRRGLSLDEFGHLVGWNLKACMDSPDRLLVEMSIDGLTWLCEALGIDWRRVLVGL